MAEGVNMHRESMAEEECRSGTATLYGRNEEWEPRVHFVAKNCKEVHQVMGSLDDLQCDSSEALFTVRVITHSPNLASLREILRVTL